MKHFKTEEWIDFVNQMLSGDQKRDMQTHLESCKRCTKEVSKWQRVRQSAAEEKRYQPPADVLRVVKAAFAGSGLWKEGKKTGGKIKVLFDSFLQPAFEGARSVASGTRQMLYQAEPYQIDVQIEAKPASNRIVVTGQLMHMRHPDEIPSDVPVTLSNLRGQIIHMATNRFGEFREEIENSGDLQLTFPGAKGKSIVISLRDALPGSKS